MRLIVLLIVLGACHKTDPSCERAVKHVMRVTTIAPPGSEPKADEQKVIDQVTDAMIDRCTSEGLSQAQLDCIVAAPSLDDRTFLLCPALVAKKPSWLIAPIGHPEVFDERRKDPGTDE